MLRRSLPLALFTLGLAAGCGGPAGQEGEGLEGELLRASEQEIKGGYRDETDTAVVGIFDTSTFSICSGSLLAPNVVLTARHCVSELDNYQYGVQCATTTSGPIRPAGYFRVTTKSALPPHPNSDHYYRVTEIVPLPVESNGLCGHDQVILILRSNVPPEEAVPLIPRVDEPLVPGEEYFAVGYGLTDDNRNDAGIRRRRDGLFVDCVGDACPSNTSVRKQEWLGDTGICSGDSGGPSIDMLGRVTGVTSRGLQGCTAPVYGSVHSWAEWIKATTVHAASLGAYEPPAWALGAPTHPDYSAPIGGECSAPEQCPATRCLDDGRATYCTRPCSETAPCPEEYVCDAEYGNVCRWDPPPSSSGGDGGGEKKKSGGGSGSEGGCSLSRPSTDPTKPIPWRSSAAFLGALALFALRRRR